MSTRWTSRAATAHASFKISPVIDAHCAQEASRTPEGELQALAVETTRLRAHVESARATVNVQSELDSFVETSGEADIFWWRDIEKTV